MTLEGCFKLSIATKLRDCPLSVFIVNPIGGFFHLFLILLDDREVAGVKDVSINSVCVIKLYRFVIFTLILQGSA